MERLTMAALTQGDDKLQNPLINNLANEVWKCKEAKQTVADAPELGDPERRGILMEAVGAVSYFMAGSNIMIMRHPEAIKLAKAFVDLICDGGSAADVAPITKKLDDVEIDFSVLAPAPDLTIVEETKAAPAKKAEAPKAAAPKAEAPKAAAPPAPKAEAAPAPKVEAAPAVDTAAEAAAAEKAVAEAKAKAEAEAKAAAAAKAKAEADAKAKAIADEKAKVEAEKKAAAQAIAQREADEQAIRDKRAAEKASHGTASAASAHTAVTMTAAKVQLSMLDKILMSLDRTHKRNVA